MVIPAGGSRLVYVLANDGDPDGDIVALVGHTTAEGLTVKEVDGIGYLVTVAPNAPKRPTFRYQISDGTSDPVTAVVVVAVTDSEVIDQPPVARTDVVEVRAGGRVAVPVLTQRLRPGGRRPRGRVGHRPTRRPRPRPGSTARPSTSTSDPT